MPLSDVANYFRGQQYQVLVDGDMSGNVTSRPFPTNKSDLSGVQAVWTGTPTGTLYIEGSVDGTNFQILDQCAVAGAAGSQVWDLRTALLWLRIRWEFTSGSGTLDVLASRKD